MRKLLVLLVLVCISTISCNNDDDSVSNTCNVSNPVEDLDWLKEKIEELEQTEPESLKYLYFSEQNYKNQTIFVLYNCDPLINYFPLVYNCEGNNPDILKTEDFFKFIALKEGGGIIWKPSTSACNL